MIKTIKYQSLIPGYNKDQYLPMIFYDVKKYQLKTKKYQTVF